MVVRSSGWLVGWLDPKDDEDLAVSKRRDETRRDERRRDSDGRVKCNGLGGMGAALPCAIIPNTTKTRTDVYFMHLDIPRKEKKKKSIFPKTTSKLPK